MSTLLVLSYDPDKPSFRYRIAPLLAELERRGWHCQVDCMPQRRYGLRLWERRAAIRDARVVLLHKFAPRPVGNGLARAAECGHAFRHRRRDLVEPKPHRRPAADRVAQP